MVPDGVMALLGLDVWLSATKADRELAVQVWPAKVFLAGTGRVARLEV